MGSSGYIDGIGSFYMRVPKLFPLTKPTWTHVFNRDGTLAFTPSMNFVIDDHVYLPVVFGD
jgi:hypothetical protein